MSISRKSSVFYMRAGVFCLMFSFAVTQSFASGIPATNGVAQPATCDVDTLGSATGPVQLRADFTPEIIDLRWYNNNTLVNVTSTSNTCTYDTAISLPTDPTKPGYKFKGWKVIPEYDFSTLQNQTGMHHWGKGKDTLTDENYCMHAVAGAGSSSPITCTDSNFSDLQPGEWKVQFNYGTVYGMGICSSSVGNGSGTYGVPNESSDGGYCWCRATGYIPNNSSVKYTRSQIVSWTRGLGWQTAADCHKYCPTNCAYNCDNTSNYRELLFGINNS